MKSLLRYFLFSALLNACAAGFAQQAPNGGQSAARTRALN